jgi:hypothetical protein
MHRLCCLKTHRSSGSPARRVEGTSTPANRGLPGSICDTAERKNLPQISTFHPDTHKRRSEPRIPGSSGGRACGPVAAGPARRLLTGTQPHARRPHTASDVPPGTVATSNARRLRRRARSRSTIAPTHRGAGPERGPALRNAPYRARRLAQAVAPTCRYLAAPTPTPGKPGIAARSNPEASACRSTGSPVVVLRVCKPTSQPGVTHHSLVASSPSRGTGARFDRGTGRIGHIHRARRQAGAGSQQSNY